MRRFTLFLSFPYPFLIWLNLSYSISLSSVWYTLRQSSRILELNMKPRNAIWGTELAMLRKPWERHRDLVAKVALDCVSRVSHHQAPSYIPACIILTMLLDSMLLAVCVNLWLGCAAHEDWPSVGLQRADSESISVRISERHWSSLPFQ